MFPSTQKKFFFGLTFTLLYIYNLMFKVTIKLNDVIEKEIKKEESKIAKTKRFSPSTRVWPNSIYAYNKNTSKTMPVKDKLAGNTIRNYLNLVFKPKVKGISTRMRNLLRRRSTTRVFMGNPEIKQTSDRVNITIYTFDRHKQLYLRRLYFFKRWLRNKKAMVNSEFYNSHLNLSHSKIKSKAIVNNKFKVNKLSKDNLRSFRRFAIYKKLFNLHVYSVGCNKIKVTRINSKILMRYIISRYKKPVRMPTSSLLVSHEINGFKERLSILLKRKKNLYKSAFIFFFIKWLISLYKIRVEIVKSKENNFYLFLHNISYYILFNINPSNGFLLKSLKKDKTTKAYNKIQVKLRGVTQLKLINSVLMQFFSAMNRNRYMFPSIRLDSIGELFKIFNYRHYKKFIRANLRKEMAVRYSYMRLMYSSFNKFNLRLPFLKVLIGIIYNKTVSLNFVKLKYPQLNSDIYMDIIATKLRKKTNSFLRVIGRALILAKLSKNPLKPDLSLESIPSVQETLYRKKTVKNVQLSFINILNSIKYKWITGIRLEGKGRLTKRYTASRSLFKYRYKGNLKNRDYKYGSIVSVFDYANKKISTVMMRNQIKPNVQYTFTKSKKRIGAFGVKGWVSAN